MGYIKPEELRPIHKDEKAWRNADGTAVQLCIIHELDPNFEDHYEACAVVGGYSVCQKHMIVVARCIKDGWDNLAIIRAAAQIGL